MADMAREDYTAHQQSIISQYYHNLDTIMLAKLQELVSELYLAETESKRDRLWKRVQQAMIKLGIPSALIEHVVAARDVAVLAANLQDWLKKGDAGSGKR
jgi:vancomycin permeability regulator SanA